MQILVLRNDKMDVNDVNNDAENVKGSQRSASPISDDEASNNQIHSPRLRRSDRLARSIATRSPSVSAERHLHRTHSGGIMGAHASKTSNRVPRTRETHIASPMLRHDAATTAGGFSNIPSADEEAKQCSLPLEQSDDEMSITDSVRRTALSTKQSNSGVLTRAQVLTYFEPQANGF